MKYEVVWSTRNPRTSLEYDLELCAKPDWWNIFSRAKMIRVRGGCTVWHYYPSGKRCSTSMETILSEIWQRLEWERRDKNKLASE